MSLGLSPFSRGLVAPAVIAVIASVGLAAAHPSAIHADTRVQARDCTRYAAEVARPTSKAARDTALAMMTPSRCRAQAVAALTAAWYAATVADIRLSDVTIALGDRRLLELMNDIALDGSRPTAVRLQALGVLVAYADPTARLFFRGLTPPYARNVAILTVADTRQERGDFPIEAADRAGIVERFEPLTIYGGDSVLRAVVTSMHAQLRERMASRGIASARFSDAAHARLFVRDTTAGMPFPHGGATFFPFNRDTARHRYVSAWYGTTSVDSSGVATARLPARLMRFTVYCFEDVSGRGPAQLELFADTITVRRGDSLPRRVAVDGSRCGWRRPTVVRGEFEGFYETGFEAFGMRIPGVKSEVQLRLGDSAARRFRDDAARQFQRDTASYACWKVRGRGRLSVIGPSRTHLLDLDVLEAVLRVPLEKCRERG
jgi:hypothetical protein